MQVVTELLCQERNCHWMFVTRLGTAFTPLISDGANALIAASSDFWFKVVVEVGEIHKLFCRDAEGSHQSFNKSSATGDGSSAQRGSI